MFQAQIKRIEKLMYRVSRSYLDNDEDAADAVQETLAKAWEKRHHLRDEAQFRPWLMRILTNQCKDILRRRKRRSFFPLEEDTVAVEMPQPHTAVFEAVQRLKPELRLLVTLYYVDGYSLQEIAAALGMPSGTVKSRLHSVRKQLSNTLLVEWEESV